MTPQETLTFFGTKIARATKGFEAASSRRDVQLAAFNAGQIFNAHLMCGLIKWRQRESPVSDFEEAVRLIAEATVALPSWGGAFNIDGGLPRGRAALLANLVGVQFDLALPGSANLPADVRLDYLLANTGPSANAKDAANALVGELRSNKRTALAAETYANYFDILSSENNPVLLGELLKTSEALFAKRARDAYFSGGDQTEGGGPDNALVVDYRLALALKKVRYGGDSMHAWIW